MKSCQRWKKNAEMRQGVERLVHAIIHRAKIASRDARKALKSYREGCQWAHADWMKYRAERANWMWAAKNLLHSTTTGVVHFNVHERLVATYRQRWEKQKPATDQAQPILTNP